MQVTFGKYANRSDSSREPLVWKVLTVEPDRALLVTEQIIDAKPFDQGRNTNDWNECSLRKWLNEDFYNSVFDANDKALIIKREDVDRVFILNASEVRFYMPTDEEKLASGMDIAKLHGLPENSKGYSNYWLRNSANLPNFAEYIKDNGSVALMGYDVSNATFGVRPAVWIKRD